MNNLFRAGISQTEISPQPGVSLGGYPHFPRHNTGIHDPLIAAGLVLNDSVTKIAIICMDMLSFSRRYVQEVRQSIAERTGIPAANIAICCSHTHSAPEGATFMELDAPGDMAQPDPNYISMLQDKLTGLIGNASADMFDARLIVDKGICGKECGVGGNRRDPNGPADPEVWIIGIQDNRGKWRAALVKYALHPTIIHEDSALVTADYPAYIRQTLEKSFPGITMLFAQGTSGDQSTRYFRKGQSFDEAERIGAAIGRTAGDVLMRQRNLGEARLGVWSEPVNLPLKTLPSGAEMEVRVKRAQERYESLKAAGASYLEIQNANLVVLGEEDTLACARMQERGDRMGFVEDELPSEMQVMGIGDARIVFLPGEVFVEIGQNIQKQSPFPKTFVVTCANGFLPGYACTAQAYSDGGYEAGTSLLTPEVEKILTGTAVKILKQSQSNQ